MKKILFLLLTAALSLSSCNDWLRLTPSGQLEATELLKDARGYDNALGGVYYMLSDADMYGKELTYGMMDVLAQYWNVSSSSHAYNKLGKYDYLDPVNRGKFDAVWKGFYDAIAQCNLILQSIEKNRGSVQYANLIEGEAYGLRAFCHMELFRMFGPVIQSDADLDKPSIAYRTQFDTEARKFESGRVVLGKVKDDLLKALECLANDPIIENGRKADLNASMLNYLNILKRRGCRMNYFGVLGMLARNEQLLLNPDEAYKYCTRIIEETKELNDLGLIDKENIEGNDGFKDLNYSSEMLFALYTNNLYDLSHPAFMMDKTGTTASSFPINSSLFTTFTNEIYGRQPDGSGTDNRLRYWLPKNSDNRYDMAKLHKAPPVVNMATPYEPEVPVMRMSEVYYIACESQIGKNNELALKYLNDVRFTRNLTNLTGTYTDEEMMEFLVREQRKDFIAEGRMFPLYKRLYREIYVKKGTIIAPSEAIFVFPIPEDEYEYSPNVKPTN